MYGIGIDIGGMSIKGGVVDGSGKIVYRRTITTEPTKDSEKIIEDIAGLALSLVEGMSIDIHDIEGLGVGCPGSVYDEAGIVRYCCNINLVGVPLAKRLAELTGIKNVKISNDANCAALAETVYGAGKGAKNSVMITLGTGLGTGIIVDGKLLTGNRSAGAEGGHININLSGPVCGCKKKGHYEAYASATALMSQVAAACAKHPDSLLAEIAKKDGISGKTAFIAAKHGDKVAKAVIKRYLRYVSVGLLTFANIFYPEIMIIGGGISNEGDAVVRPIQRYISANVYGAEYNPKIKVVAATLKNDAGIIGAATLCRI